MKKQIKLLSLLGLIITVGGSCALSILTTSCSTKLDISSVIKSKNLGQISGNNQITIQAAIISKNSATAT
jgi:hypothetical protein